MRVILTECLVGRTVRLGQQGLPKGHQPVLDLVLVRLVMRIYSAPFVVLSCLHSILTHCLRSIPLFPYRGHSSTSAPVAAMRKLNACTNVVGKDAKRHTERLIISTHMLRCNRMGKSVLQKASLSSSVTVANSRFGLDRGPSRESGYAFFSLCVTHHEA